jgi:hypothetical protein
MRQQKFFVKRQSYKIGNTKQIKWVKKGDLLGYEDGGDPGDDLVNRRGLYPVSDDGLWCETLAYIGLHKRPGQPNKWYANVEGVAHGEFDTEFEAESFVYAHAQTCAIAAATREAKYKIERQRSIVEQLQADLVKATNEFAKMMLDFESWDDALSKLIDRRNEELSNG